MKKHGDSANSVEDKEDVAKALRQFQWFAGVPVTGTDRLLPRINFHEH